jgi:sec-independent protein translocase protein TatA
MIEALSPVPLFFGLPAGPEMIVVLLIVVLLFGANKLPKLARASGQALGEFQKGRTEIERELADMTDTEDDGDADAADADLTADADAAADADGMADDLLEPETEPAQETDSDVKPAA